MVVGVNYWPEYIRGAIFTDPQRCLADPGVNHGGNRTNPRGSSAVRGLNRESSSVTVLWRTPFSWSDRAHLRAICAKFCVVTRPTLCIKVAALQTIFIFVIASLVKFSLDHA
jgi:hypothetical protein